MKKIIAALGVATSIFAGPVLAQTTASNAISVGGTAVDVCLIRTAPTVGALTNATLSNLGAGAGTIAIDTLANTTDATLNAASIQLTFPAMCNNTHRVSVTSAQGGLQNASAVENTVMSGSANFIRKVGYTVGYTWAGSTGGGLALSTNSGTGGSGPTAGSTTSTPLQISGANDGNLVMTIAVAAVANTPVVAGSYTDTLTLTFSSVI